MAGFKDCPREWSYHMPVPEDDMEADSEEVWTTPLSSGRQQRRAPRSRPAEEQHTR